MSSQGSSMTWNLSDQGMGLLERAGLAALFMSLRTAQEQMEDLSPLHWEPDDLQSQSVTLRWEGSDREAMTRLMRWAWQVRDGVLYFPAIHRSAKQRDFAFQRVATHNGILSTFLQHPNVQRKGRPVRIVETIEEGKEYTYYYQTLDPTELADRAAAKRSEKTKPQSVSSEGRPKSRKKAPAGRRDYLRPITILSDEKTKVFERDGSLSKASIELKSWATPGIAGRFGDEKAWVGPAKLGLLLMLAPIACLYLRLPPQRKKTKDEGSKGSEKKAKGKKDDWTNNWVYVVPYVENLEEFGEARPILHLDPKFVDVASLGDAALRFVAEYCTTPYRRELRVGCRATAMGKVTFYPNQMVRKGILDVEKGRPPRRYLLLHHAIDHQFISRKGAASLDAAEDGEGAECSGSKQRVEVRLPSVRGRIADNLVSDQPWYTDLAIPTTWERDILDAERKRLAKRPGGAGKAPSIERLCFRNLIFQKGRLMELIQKEEMWDSPSEAMFVQAFWETLRSLYRQEAKAAKRGGSRTPKKRIGHLKEDIYRSLMRSKTRELTRQAVAELIAKASRSHRPGEDTVRGNPAAIWRLIDDPHDWKRARDLALLALATYTKKQADPEAGTPAKPKGENA
jgi:CRISPR-associated protein Cas8a1/Csx13